MECYWHIDHNNPCNNFDLTNIEQQYLCFNWKNLRPLQVSKNYSKQDKYNPNGSVLQEIKANYFMKHFDNINDNELRIV